MRELTLFQVQQVSGATIYYPGGCKADVPSTGLTPTIFKAIEVCIQFNINYPNDVDGFNDKLYKAITAGVTPTHLSIYEENMKKAVWTCVGL